MGIRCVRPALHPSGFTDTHPRLFHGVMDFERRQRVVERVWLLEQLRAEAKANARRAQREAADLHERAAELGGELAELRDELGDTAKAAEERADARAERRKAADDRKLDDRRESKRATVA